MVRLQIITLLLALSASALAQSTFTTTTSGDWDDGGTWGNTSPGVQGTDWPAITDHAVIDYGHTVTLQQSNTIANFTITLGGQFYFNAFTLTANGTVTPFVAQATGDFDQASTWLNGAAPGTTNDDIVITVGIRVTLVTGTVLNDLSISSSAVFDDGGNTIQVDGNLYLNGIMAGSKDLQFSGGGTTIDGGGGHSAKNFDINGSTTILSSANLTFGATVDMINAGTTTNNGSVTFVGDLKSTGAASTWINADNSTLKATLTVFNGGGNLQASATGNTVIYSEAGNQTIKDAVLSTYYNLTIAGTGTKTLSTSSIVLGDLVISSGTFSAPTSFTLGGDFTSSGTFDENTGTVTFDGTGDQTITNTGGETFYDVVVDKASGTLILADNAIASNSLTLTQGLVDAGTSILTLGTGTGNEGTLTHTAGQIIGQFERWVASSTTATDIVFPVGSAANENPAVINFSGITTGGTIIFQFIESDPGNAGLPLTDVITINNSFVDGFWDIDEANSFNLGGPNDFTLSLAGAGFTAFTIAADTRLLTRPNDASNWVAEGTHVAAVSPVVNRSLLSTMPAQYAFGDKTLCTPPSTSVITGTAEVCTGDGAEAYSVVNTPLSSYAWIVTGGTIAGGDGTSAITVNWGATGIVGNVRVVETNTCTSGAAVDFPVNVNSIAPTSITGATIVPEFTLGIAYSVTGLAGYTYTWTITGGTQATGGTASSITVDWTFPGVGNVSVVALKAGCTAAAAFDIDVIIYDVINSITSGPWRTSATWETNTVPGSVENARIMNGDVVAISNNETINHFIIQLGGTLNIPSNTLTVDGDITVDGFYQGVSKDLILDGINSNLDGSGTINIGATGGIDIGTGPKTIAATAVLTILNGDLDIGIGITVTNKGSIEVADNITGGNASSSIWINDVNSNLTIGTSIFASKGVLNATAVGNHVIYNGVAQNIEVPSATTYQNLSLEGSGAKTLEGSIQINADFDISGTASLDGATNSASVTMGGTVAQIITDLSSGMDFYDLIINNSFGTMPQINTSGAMNVTNSATFTDGIISNSGAFTFTDATATSTTNSYVDGPVEFIAGGTNTAFTYPLGDGAIWARLGVSTLTSGAQFTGQYFYTDPQIPFGTAIDVVDFPNPAAVISQEEYWQLDHDAGVSSANVTLYWEDGTRSGITDLTDLTITKWDATDWGNDVGIATTTSGAPAAGSVTTTSPYTTFSPFSFASPIGNNALPVELVYFRGKLFAEGVVLEWQTASELNNDFFEVEVSTDGENYNTLAIIAGQGTSTTLTNYDYVDRYPSTGLNYYRLRQVDFNGDFTYSNIISIMNDAPARLYFSAYPQPATTHLTLQLMGIDDTSIMNLVIYNINGKVVKSISIDPKTKLLPIDLTPFTNGLYLVRLNQAEQAFHGRLLIQK